MGIRLQDARGGRIAGHDDRTGEWAGDLELRVIRALEEVRPGLEADGGDVELVGIADGIVRLRLLGACARCPYAERTLVEFIAERILLHAPEIRRVDAV